MHWKYRISDATSRALIKGFNLASDIQKGLVQTKIHFYGFKNNKSSFYIVKNLSQISKTI